MGYTHEHENLGEIGSFNYIGPNFASAAASPLSYFKFHTGEGGVRVPLIMSGPGIESQSGFQNAAVHVTDIAPTILAMANVEPPQERFGGRQIEPMSGKNILPLLDGAVAHIYEPNDYVGYELAGSVALFNDGYKIVFNWEPLGDGTWHLFDIVNDPGETIDLKAQNPDQFQHMLNLYQRYTAENGVQPVPDHHTSNNDIAQKVMRNQIGNQLVTLILTGSTVGIFAIFGWQHKRKTT